MKNSAPTRFLVKPGIGIDEHRQAAIGLFRALLEREPTSEEIRELDETIEQVKRQRVVSELTDSLGRSPLDQEINLHIARADASGEY